jgi:hypothetical protein
MNGSLLIVAAWPRTCLPLGWWCSLRCMRRFGWVGAVALVGCVAWSGVVRAQKVTALVEPPAPLLPQTFGKWHASGMELKFEGYSLANTNEAALKECGPVRAGDSLYLEPGGSSNSRIVEAIQFGDRSSAYSAYTAMKQPDMREGTEVGSWDAIGKDGVLFQEGTTIVLAHAATAADVPQLKLLAGMLPKVSGSKNQPPLLPTFAPAKGLVDGSVRYALGPAAYEAEGGTLPAAQLGWDKSAEAVTAQYADKRGKETLTLLLYPTPQIAGDHARLIETQVGSAAKVRREGELVIVAAGTFSADDTQNMEENIHLRSQVTFDKTMPLDFQTEIHKTYSLLASIAVFCCVGGLAAVLLGVFLGGGRALVRKMQGKDAATDSEFLSLHLEPQNPRPKFDPPGS